jgi:hypothetical protein
MVLCPFAVPYRNDLGPHELGGPIKDGGRSRGHTCFLRWTCSSRDVPKAVQVSRRIPHGV